MQSPMKKLISIFLPVVLLFLAAVAAVAVLVNNLNKESKLFVDAAVPAIIADWDVREIQKRASPEFNATVDYDDMLQMFDILRDLGDLQEYYEAAGESKITLSLESGLVITALYEASADFEEGSADIQISLIRHGGQWQILGFKVAPGEREERKNII